MADVAVREYLESNSTLLEDIRGTLIQSNTRLESVVDILTVQSNTLAEQMRIDRLAGENEELRLAEASREADRAQASASMDRDSAPDTTGALDTPTRGGLLRNLVTAGLLAALGYAAYRYFGLDEFKDELLSDEAYNDFKKNVGDKFDSLIFGEQTESGERVGGLMGAIQENPVGAAAAGAGLVTFLMKGARFRALPAAMASFMLGYIGLNAFFNPEGNQEVAKSIDEGIDYLETEFGTEFFNILRDDYGIDVTGEGVVNLLEAAAVYKGTSLALRLFGVRGRGKFLIPLAGAMAHFAFSYFGLDEFFRPDNEEEFFDFLESETMAEYGGLIASALAMGAVTFGPGMGAALAAGAAARGRSRAPKGSRSLSNRMFGRLPGGGRGALIALAATAIAAYAFNRLGLDDIFSGDPDFDDSIDEAAEDAFQRQIDAAAVGAAVGLGLGAANTRYARRGYVYDRQARRYRIAPGSQNAGRFASRAVAERTALEAFPKLARLFRAIPGLQAAFGAYDGYYIITDPNLTTTEKVSMLGGVFAGIGLSAILAGAGALVGGPFGAVAGGLVGYMAGDYVVTQLLLWVLSDNDEALSALEAEASRIQGERDRVNAIAAAERAQMGDGITPGTAIGLGGVTVSTDPGSLFTQYRGQSGVTMAEDEIARMIQQSGVTNYSLSPEEIARINRESTYIPPVVEPEVIEDVPNAEPQSQVIPSTDGKAKVSYNMGPKRPNMPNPDIVRIARDAATQVFGPNSEIIVTSGMGEYGSTRHRGGHAIDLQIKDATGKLVNVNSAEFERFIMTAATLGAKGFGAGEEYMGPETFHLDNFPRELYSEDQDEAWGSIGNRLQGNFIAAQGSYDTSMLEGDQYIAERGLPKTVTPSALKLGTMSGNINIPVTTVVNNIDNSQMIAGRGSGAARTAAARNVRIDTSYTSAAMSQFA